MEKVENALIETKEIVRKNCCIIPEGKWEATPFGFELRESSHLFLQKFLDRGPRIFKLEDQELTFYVSNSIMLIRIYKTHTELVCISTYEDKRRKGSGCFTMKLLTSIADETDTILKLTTAHVTGHGLPGIPQNPAIVQGTKPQRKIPAEKLVTWFENFGFVKGERYKGHSGGKWLGYYMERQPSISK